MHVVRDGWAVTGWCKPQGMPTTDQLIHQQARLGLVSRSRLLSLGISDEQIYGRLERGTLRTIHPGVYATFGTPLDYRARTLAACLAAGPGAVASHRTALSMWGLLEGEQPIVLTAPRQSHPLPESMIEPLMARLLYATDLGIGPIEYQPTLVLDGVELRPDFLVSLAMTVVEIDGLDAHASREALDNDLARQNLLVRHGYLVLRYTTTHLRRPAAVLREIVDTCRQRIATVEQATAA